MPPRTRPGALPRVSFRPAAEIGTLFRRDDRDLVEKYGKMLAPFFRLEISNPNEEVLFSAQSLAEEGGWELNGLIISGLEWDETDCKCDSLTLEVNNYDLTLQDSELFSEGNNVDLWMGYDGHQPEYMGRAIIVEKEPTFQEGPATMEVRCYDISYFMMEEGRAEIQEEGSEWWERARVPAEGQGQPPPAEMLSDAVSDSERDREDRRRTAAALGLPDSFIPEQTVADIGPQENLAERPIHVVQSQSVQTPLEPERPPAQRTVLRKTNPGKRRQRKNDGKVWRGMTDSEIAAAIFDSYGILAYAEATNEARRSQVTRQVRQENQQNLSIEALPIGMVPDNQQNLQTMQDEFRRAGLEDLLPRDTVSDNADTHDLSIEPITYQRTEREEAAAQPPRTETVVVDRKVVQKSGTSDWDFLKKLAATHNYIVFVFFHYESRKWIGYFGAQDKVPQWIIYRLHYARGDDTSIKSIKPRISMRNQSTEIDLTYVDPVSRKTNRLRVEIQGINRFTRELQPSPVTQTTRPLGTGPEVVLSIHGQRVRTVADHAFSSAEDARQWLMSFWYRYAQEFCEMEGECLIGLPELHARARHGITGIGRAAGDYFFTSVKHTMRSGEAYKTSISGFRVIDEIGRVSQDTVHQVTMGEETPAAPATQRTRAALKERSVRYRQNLRRDLDRADRVLRERQR